LKSRAAGLPFTVACPESALGSASELKAALSAALAARGKARTGNTSLEMLRVRVKKAMRKARLVDRALQSADASHARIGLEQFRGEAAPAMRRFIAGSRCIPAIGWRVARCSRA